MDTPDTPIHSHSDAPCSHLINMPEKDEGDELPHPEPVTASDIWKHMRNYIPWILAVTSVIQICLFVLDRDEFFRLLVFSPHRILEIWRFLSYTLLHQNAIHLALNVAIQIFLGIPLEYEQGHWRVFVVYFGGAVAGALGTSVFEPSILLIGASADIYSILMSHIPHTVINFKNIRYRFYRIILHLPKIGISAHILGALSGLVLGTALFQSATQRDSKFKRIQLAAGAIYLTWLLSSFTISLVGSHLRGVQWTPTSVHLHSKQGPDSSEIILPTRYIRP
uniref:Rhomboid-like protein n=2 Tax=Lutzomyia longipalpis TaxID=7200 RepID=A0A1B0CGS4_LUTLO